MFATRRARRWAGVAALAAVAIAAGCRNAQQMQGGAPPLASPAMFGAKPSPAKPEAPTVAKPESTLPDRPAAPPAAAAEPPSRLPPVTTGVPPIKLESLPAVSNERYVAPPKPQLVEPSPMSSNIPPAPRPPAATEVVTVKPLAPVQDVVKIPSLRGLSTDQPRVTYTVINQKPEFYHAPDYSTLTGELSFVPAKNQWRLRYAAIDVEDRYGGSVTLDTHQMLKEFRSGELIRVQGELVDKNDRSLSPMYRVKDVSTIR